MKRILYSLYILLALLSFTSFAPTEALAADTTLCMVEEPQATPRVEVRDGRIVPIGTYDYMQVFNVMGQEVYNEHLVPGIYLVRLVAQGETYILKVIVR